MQFEQPVHGGDVPIVLPQRVAQFVISGSSVDGPVGLVGHDPHIAVDALGLDHHHPVGRQHEMIDLGQPVRVGTRRVQLVIDPVLIRHGQQDPPDPLLGPTPPVAGPLVTLEFGDTGFGNTDSGDTGPRGSCRYRRAARCGRSTLGAVGPTRPAARPHDEGHQHQNQCDGNDHSQSDQQRTHQPTRYWPPHSALHTPRSFRHAVGCRAAMVREVASRYALHQLFPRPMDRA